MDKERAWYFPASVFDHKPTCRIVCTDSQRQSRRGCPACFTHPCDMGVPQRVIGGIVLIAAMSAYGMTLAYQPISLSISQWILFPLLMVVFSRRSSFGVLVTVSLIV